MRALLIRRQEPAVLDAGANRESAMEGQGADRAPWTPPWLCKAIGSIFVTIGRVAFMAWLLGDGPFGNLGPCDFYPEQPEC
jgi:hypothetical protein